MPKHGGNGPALPGPLRACFSAARAARAASGSDGVGTSPQRDFRARQHRLSSRPNPQRTQEQVEQKTYIVEHALSPLFEKPRVLAKNENEKCKKYRVLATFCKGYSSIFG